MAARNPDMPPGFRIPIGPLPTIITQRFGNAGRLNNLIQGLFPQIPPQVNVYREAHQNSFVITPQEFMPEVHARRITSTNMAYSRVDHFDNSNLELQHELHWVQVTAFDGWLKMFSVNISDFIGLVHTEFQNVGDMTDPDILDMASLVAYCLRKLRINYEPPQNPRAVENILHNENFEYPNVPGHNQQLNNLRAFINRPLQAREQANLTQIAIHLYAAYGNLIQAGNFRGLVGGMQSRNYQGYPLPNPGEFTQRAPGGDRRDEYTTFKDVIIMPRVHRTNDARMSAGAWRQVRDYLNELGQAPSGQELGFTLGRIGFITSRVPAGGMIYANDTPTIINNMKCMAPKSEVEGNCLFSALRWIRCRYLKNNLQKKNHQVIFLCKGDPTSKKKEEFPIQLFNMIRQQFNMPNGQGIAVDDFPILQVLANLFEISFKIIDENKVELVHIKSKNAVLFCLLVFHRQHYYVNIDGIRDRTLKRCACGKTPVQGEKHRCNLNELSYYQFQLRNKDKHLWIPKWDNRVFKEEDYDIEKNVVFYDVETFQKGENREHTIYSIGFYYDGAYQVLYGKDCIDEFLVYLISLPKNLKIKLAAWNGAKYDHRLLIRYILTSEEWRHVIELESPLFNNNRLLNCNLGKHIQLWDPCQYIKKSLREACKDFQLDAADSKDVFPHLLMAGYNDINRLVNIQMLNNPSYYFETDAELLKSNPWSVDKMTSLNIKPVVYESYKLKDIGDYYLKLDVMSMREICIKAFKCFANKFELNCFTFPTISSMTKCGFYVNNEWRSLIYKPEDEIMNYIIRRGVIGGRVEVYKNRFIADKFNPDLVFLDHVEKHITNGYDLGVYEEYKYEDFENNCMVEFDYTSLYPSAMVGFDYPCGLPEMLTEDDIFLLNQSEKDLDIEDLKKLTEITNRVNLFYIEYIPNPWLPMAMLGKREEDGTLSWTNEPGKDWFYDLEVYTAIDCNYKVKFLGGMYWPEKHRVFNQWVEKTFSLKKEGEDQGNGAKRECGKLAGNACYGSMLTKDTVEDYRYIYSTDSFINFTKKHHIKYAEVYDDHCALVGGCKPIINPATPAQLGGYILAGAKRLMFLQYVKLIPELKTPPCLWNETLWKTVMERFHYYTDTDSLLFHNKYRDRFDIVGDELGMIKDESVKKGRILAFWSSGNKEYGTINILKNNHLKVTIKSKGIRPKKLDIRDIRNSLLYNESKKFELEGIKMWSHHSAENSNSAHSVTYTKTLGGKAYNSRVRVNRDGVIDIDGEWSKPYGPLSFVKPRKERVAQFQDREDVLKADQALSLEDYMVKYANEEDLREDESNDDPDDAEEANESTDLTETETDSQSSSSHLQFTQVATQDLNTLLVEEKTQEDWSESSTETSEDEEVLPVKKRRKRRCPFIDDQAGVAK